MILHTLNGAPDSTAFRDCIRLLQTSDALLLMGDGVYTALSDSCACLAIKNTGAELYLLQPDTAAAGLLTLVDSAFTIVDYQGFAALTERYTTQQAWF